MIKIKNIFGVVLAFAMTFLMVADVFAEKLEISANPARDDIYNQLAEAAELNALGSAVRRCFDGQLKTYVSGKNINEGDVFVSQGWVGEHTGFLGKAINGVRARNVPLWLEKKVGQIEPWDGKIYCYEGSDKENNVLNLFSDATGLSMDKIFCNGGKPRIFGLQDSETLEMTDQNCAILNDDDIYISYRYDEGVGDVVYLDALGEFDKLWNNWRDNKITENPYVVKADGLGKYNNVDGYFNYFRDFNARCSADVFEQNPGSDYSTTALSLWDKDDKLLTEKKNWYYISKSEDIRWDGGGLTPKAAPSCQEILYRMRDLEQRWNGIVNTKYGPAAGYGGVLIENLDNACRSAILENAKEIREGLKKKMEAEGEETHDCSKLKGTAKTECKKSKSDTEKQLDFMKNLPDCSGLTGTPLTECQKAIPEDQKWYKSSGDEESESGKIYQCKVDVDVKDYGYSYDEELENDGSEEVEANCMNSGAMESLGWIICPALTLAGNWAEGVYEKFVEPALEVESEGIFAENSSAVREEGWARFRDFANIVFVILFLVIIFSQLTGVGIDNYGIKKILPKLIVAAIMINLSYFVCVVAVDLSNIVGAGLKGLFDNINVAVPAEIEGGIGIEGVGKGALTMVTVLAALVTGVWTVLADGGWVGLAMMIILAALSIIISLCFFFLILAAREAAIVVLVIISPLAVVAYMLPNTKNLFDKWWKMFKGLLMVYPICGLLVGGGDFVSRLLLAVGGGSFFSALAAMLVGVVPIFFIPKVLKSSLAAVGDIGAKVQGFGQGMAKRARGGVENAVKNSEHAQQWKAASLDRINARREVRRDTLEARRNARGMRSRNARVRAAAVEREGARLAANAKVERLGDENGIQTRLASIAAAEDAKAVDEATTQRLSLMRSTGDDGGIVLENGQRVMATRDNMEARMQELEMAARGRALSTDETQELGALARGLAGEKGGASRINQVVRNAKGANGGVNTNFMAAMSQIYQQDAAVAGKMKEKDGTMGAYMEQGAQEQYSVWAGAPATDGNGRAIIANGAPLTNAQRAMSGSMGSYEAGLNQGGKALSEYINGLTAEDCQRIYDQDLNKVLDSDDQNTFATHAEALGVKGKSTTNVNVAGGTVGLDGPVEVSRMDEINSQLAEIHSTARNIEGAAELKHVGYTDENGQKVPVYQKKDGTYVKRDGTSLNIDLR